MQPGHYLPGQLPFGASLPTPGAADSRRAHDIMQMVLNSNPKHTGLIDGLDPSSISAANASNRIRMMQSHQDLQNQFLAGAPAQLPMLPLYPPTAAFQQQLNPLLFARNNPTINALGGMRQAQHLSPTDQQQYYSDLAAASMRLNNSNNPNYHQASMLQGLSHAGLGQPGFPDAGMNVEDVLRSNPNAVGNGLNSPPSPQPSSPPFSQNAPSSPSSSLPPNNSNNKRKLSGDAASGNMEENAHSAATAAATSTDAPSSEENVEQLARKYANYNNEGSNLLQKHLLMSGNASL